MRIVFMGSPEFAVPSLEALAASSHPVVGVITQPDRPFGRKLQLHPPPVKTTAVGLGIPVLQPETTRTAEFVEQVHGLHPDVLVVVAYGEILRPALLQSAPAGAVNLHASLLPKYRGAAPVAAAILNGDLTTGCSTMLVEAKMDAGPVYLQESCEIEDSDTTGSLTVKLSRLGAPLLVKTLDLISQNALRPSPQDHAAATLAPKLRKEHGWIQWDHSARQIALQVRAFDPWPGSFSLLDGTLIKLWKTRALEDTSDAPPGTVFRTGEHLDVICGAGTTLRVLELQPENKARLKAADFLHGARIHPGSRFLSEKHLS